MIPKKITQDRLDKVILYIHTYLDSGCKKIAKIKAGYAVSTKERDILTTAIRGVLPELADKYDKKSRRQKKARLVKSQGTKDVEAIASKVVLEGKSITAAAEEVKPGRKTTHSITNSQGFRDAKAEILNMFEAENFTPQHVVKMLYKLTKKKRYDMFGRKTEEDDVGAIAFAITQYAKIQGLYAPVKIQSLSVRLDLKEVPNMEEGKLDELLQSMTASSSGN